MQTMILVFQILDFRVNDSNQLEYLIKWYHFDHSSNTWELEENLNCPILLERFRNNIIYDL